MTMDGSLKLLSTEFAPAERLGSEAIIEQNRKIKESPIVKSVLNAIPEAVLILNQHRQAVFVNSALINNLKLTEEQLLRGDRPGELLKCDHSDKSEGGCGTTRYCRQCGAALATLASQEGEIREEECRISQKESGTALDLRIKAAPFYFKGENYTIFSILDISDEKRRDVLQRIFLHDILNTAGGLSGYSELLKMAEEGEDTEEYKEVIFNLTKKIISEIRTQKELLAAENGQLEPDFEDLNSIDILNNVVHIYEQHEVSKNKKLTISKNAESIDFYSDETLLTRVLGNLIKNALEASRDQGEVTVGVMMQDNQVVFSVQNQTTIPEEIQLQLFRRSFSTKGAGRGLGTYSVKLLTEKYLKGNVNFLSNEQKGTEFSLILPVTA